MKTLEFSMLRILIKDWWTQLHRWRCLIKPDSLGIDAGDDVGLPFAGKAPDVGWKELDSEAIAPKYPPVLIDGEDDEDAILYLWEKTKR